MAMGGQIAVSCSQTRCHENIALSGIFPALSSIALIANTMVLSRVNATDGIAISACLIHCMIIESN